MGSAAEYLGGRGIEWRGHVERTGFSGARSRARPPEPSRIPGPRRRARADAAGRDEAADVGRLAQGPQKGGDLLVGLVGGESTNSLDPAEQLTQVPQVFTKTWGETLVYAEPEDSSPMPMLAESWEASDDVKEWRFKIRKGVTFHDGKELTPGRRGRDASAAIPTRTRSPARSACSATSPT